MIGKLTLNPDKTITVKTRDAIITYEFASFGARFVARIIDGLIIVIPSAFVPLIPGWLYWSLMQSGKDQSTVGQSALGIKVLSLDGTKISFGQATGRFFANLLNVFTFLIGFFMYFFNDKCQCLHDNLSGCIVVKEIDRKFESDLIEKIGTSQDEY